jgi:hypothetical protein
MKYPISRPSKIYPNWDFWLENIPSGNPDSHLCIGAKLAAIQQQLEPQGL